MNGRNDEKSSFSGGMSLRIVIRTEQYAGVVVVVIVKNCEVHHHIRLYLSPLTYYSFWHYCVAEEFTMQWHSCRAKAYTR